MAKRKSTRPNLPEDTLARARAELYGDAAVETSSVSGTSETRPSSSLAQKRVARRVSVEELREEYAYVLNDLQSMALLAVVLIIGMIVASLVLV